MSELIKSRKLVHIGIEGPDAGACHAAPGVGGGEGGAASCREHLGQLLVDIGDDGKHIEFFYIKSIMTGVACLNRCLRPPRAHHVTATR